MRRIQLEDSASFTLSHAEWMDRADEEYGRILALLTALPKDAWSAATDCPEWDVRKLVAHLVGAAEASASPRESVHQVRAGKKLHPGGAVVDRMNALQVHERAGHTPATLLKDLTEASVRTVAARRRIPIAVRAIPVPWGPPLGVRSLGYLMDRIYTRDAWMHRIDISRATGTGVAATATHDGRIVADIVHEWAAKHRQPFQLELTGTAGGRWSSGIGGEQICLEAIEFGRVLSGRGKATGLLTIGVPF